MLAKISRYAVCKLANFWAPKQTLPVSDYVINNYNYPIYLTAVCKLAPVFVVKVSRPYFSTRPQGAREKFGLGTRLVSSRYSRTTRPLVPRPKSYQSGNETVGKA